MVELGISRDSAPRFFFPACLASVRRTFPANVPLYMCAVLFCSATFAVTQIYGIRLEASAGLFFLDMVWRFVFLGVAVLALYEFIVLVRTGFPEHPRKIMVQRMTAKLTAEDRPGNIFHSLAALTPLMVSFAALKDQIPAVHPFAWDKTFMMWDRVVGLGHQPWEILQPLLGHPWITASINFGYDGWFLLMFLVLFSQAFAAKGSVLRLQFLLAFSFAWFIGGNVLALVFSSVGPCFYGHLYPGHDPYAAQMAYLQAANQNWPIWSVDVQQTLWKDYLAGHGQYGGISAMPSMHVTVAVLLALWGWRVSRAIGWALTVFATLIVIGSIHLLWHYAIDGIAGAILATIFWIAAGKIARATELYLARRPVPALGAATDISVA